MSNSPAPLRVTEKNKSPNLAFIYIPKSNAISGDFLLFVTVPPPCGVSQ